MINRGMKNKLNNNGQVLLIVVVAMAVTLGVGLGITSRSTDSLKRTGNLDSLQKVTAAAEGGLEKQLLLTDQELENNLQTSTPFLTEFLSNDTVSEVTVGKLTAGSSGMIYERIKPSESVTFLMAEFSNAPTLITPTNNACVKLEVTPPVDYMLNVVTSNPSVQLFEPATTSALSKPTNVIKTNAYLMENYLYSGGTFKSVSPANCPNGYFQFNNAYLLRFQPLSAEVTKLTVLTSNSNIQKITQGFKLISKGRFKDGIADKTSRTIEAYKYLDTPSSIYDYTLFLDN